MNHKIAAVLIVLALLGTLIEAKRAFRIPLQKRVRTLAERKARWAAIESGDYARNAVQKFRIMGGSPIDHFKNYDDVRLLFIPSFSLRSGAGNSAGKAAVKDLRCFAPSKWPIEHPSLPLSVLALVEHGFWRSMFTGGFSAAILSFTNLLLA
jgi:hypothetical protein